MKVGLLGLPGCGKSTLFSLLTGTVSQATPTRGFAALAPVPDPRLDVLADLYQTEKVTPAVFEVVDLPALMPGGGGLATAHSLEAIADADALIHVVRAFPGEPQHPLGDLDPLRDAQAVVEELLLADWALVEKRIERLQAAKKKTPEVQRELAWFQALHAELEAKGHLRDWTGGEDAPDLLRQYPLYSLKPSLLVLNVAEDDAAKPAAEIAPELAAWAQEEGLALIPVSVAVEAEIAELPPDERGAFLADLGLEQPGTARIAAAAFALLDRIVFLTAGPKECRAWSIPRGSNAARAGRAIHSDIERGFIRAEVVAFDDLARSGSMQAARQQGLVRLEGRDYIVQDGDVIEFRFNV